MAVKRKDFQANTVLKASEVEQVQDNGVIQCNTEAELQTLPDTVRLAFVTADESVYVYKSGVWKKFTGAGANPLGAMMAYGINGNPPAGWQICNGGTAVGPLRALMEKVPDLINRTVVGIGSGHNYNVADGTGSNSITVAPTTTDHTHGFSSSHNHAHNHQHQYTRGIYHRHSISYRAASMKKPAGSSDPYIRFDSTNTSHSGVSYVGDTSSYTNSGTNGSTSNGTASGTTTGSSVTSSNQTFNLDNYPPNRAFHWIIYNGSDV